MGRKVLNTKDCFCHTCGIEVHSLGIMPHRVKHKRKKEDCEITFTYGNKVKYNYSEK